MHLPTGESFVARPPEPAPPGPRILVVDDEARLRYSLKRLLESNGRQIDECATGGEAVAALSRQHYDLVLLDLRLPDMTGLQVMDRLKTRLASMTVIVVSADDVIDSAIGALRLGAYDFVRKPYQPEELLNTVNNALQRRALEQSHARISARLEQSERLHRYLVDHSPDIIYTVNEDGQFTYLNPTVAAMLGYPNEELIGRHYSSIIHEDDRDRARYAFCERRTGERASRNVELRLKRRPSGAAGEAEDEEHLTIALSATGVYVEQNPGEGRRLRFLGSYGVARDITERKRAEERISFQAYHDLLTQLPNRALFKDRLSVALTQAQRSGRLVAVLFIDLDRFKLINDSLGHAEGDELLKGVAGRLQSCVRRSDTLARLGGDEFTILLPDLSDPEDAALISQKVIDELRRPLTVGGQEVRATASIGIALYPNDGSEAESLVKHADIAMYHVKTAGKNAYAFFSPEMNAAFHQKLTLETELRRALDLGEFELWYQPQVSVSRRQVVAMEALIRWRHPQRGVLDPMTFIPVAEEAGLIGRVSDWVLEQACQQLAGWRAEGFDYLRMSVNLSPRDFDRPDVVERVLAALHRHRVPPQGLEIEITETLMMRDAESVSAAVKRLRDSGVRVSIDDFGTRFASFGYLQKFSVTSLKLDQSFVRDLTAVHPYSPIIVAIVGIARGFDLHLIAEGVESELQRDVLLGLGCDEMQGFLFGSALEASQARALLAGDLARGIAG
ncbi:MAG TPA: EAL domain-containing protein [Burkholderiales bacterium]|nr:EAL domain-containing protein [Burkholderiales bacterium]